MKIKSLILAFVCFMMSASVSAALKDTFQPYAEGEVAQTFEQLWDGYDPRKEPLDVEVLKQWEQDGVVFKVLRYRVGVFKGQKAMVAAVYGYPKGGKNLPALVQAHGGGQYADSKAVLYNAKRGYATITIAWAGRLNAQDYLVNPTKVKLFWDNKTSDPNYLVTTDWGALEGYHAPSRFPGSGNTGTTVPTKYSIDKYESPRNVYYFLWTLASRRALTFLEQQPEVDGSKLGIYGHSMGGKITVLTAGTDDRIKAAVPSCGGISDYVGRTNNIELYRRTMSDSMNLAHIKAPTMFLSPANDFHGHLKDLPTAVKTIKSPDYRVVCSAHYNHQDCAESTASGLLWFDQYLKGGEKLPKTPEVTINLKTKSNVPTASVKVDGSMPIKSVVLYYTLEGDVETSMQLNDSARTPEGDVMPGQNERDSRVSRYWHYTKLEKSGKKWVGDMPVNTTKRDVWVYAMVNYEAPAEVVGANYYFSVYKTNTFNISSVFQVIKASDLAANKVEATIKPATVIENFDENWKLGWFATTNTTWEYKTNKVFNEVYRAPAANAKLVFELRSEQANTLVLSIDDFVAEVKLKGGNTWESVVLNLADFKDADGKSLPNWYQVKQLSLASTVYIWKKDRSKRVKFGGAWKGKAPEFKVLKWSK